MQERQSSNKIQSSGQDGFTMIEVLLAMAIFAIGILALGSLQLSYIRGNTVARFETDTTVLAAQTLERFKGLPTSHVDLGDGDHGPIAINSNYELEWTVIDNGPYNNVKEVILTVTPLARRGRPLSVASYIAEDDD